MKIIKEIFVICYLCSNSSVQPVCEDCLSKFRFINGCVFCLKDCQCAVKFRAIWEYDQLTRKLILQFKYNEKVELSKFFIPYLLPHLSEKSYVITYVPTSFGRIVDRGYNQSCILAHELSKHIDAPVITLFSKYRNTSQKGLSYAERLFNAAQYQIKDLSPALNQHVIIIDDVIASGATVRVLSEFLQKKAKTITCLSIAKSNGFLSF